ncbi:DUF4154 domain-containing protein [Sulfurimonas aquatica]|uniref:DUF4154 domain-containing protein n=1 Tax=Sulfurimonas aquatica TaxID=2672570 RepID=A0A975GCT3_9BACT|nr:YfiR family protein [Sulfurimonas aquatica]QSZ42036.1 DUF4154 domain-containing protein [Sulfurimonas aquatica]
MITKIFLLFITSSLFLTPLSMADGANVKDIKVAYIYNFIRYINWPDSHYHDDLFHICVHEKSDLITNLEVLEKKSVKSKPIKLILISNKTEKLARCEVLVLPKLNQQELKMYTDYAAPSNILTISDTQGYAKLNVMINLIVLNNKIKFEVNLHEVDTTQLTISSSLLKLAKIVKNEE